MKYPTMVKSIQLYDSCNCISLVCIVQQQLIEAVENSLFEVDAVLPLVGFSVWRLHALLVQTG